MSVTKKKFRFKKILSVIFCLFLITLTCVMPCFASTDATLYAIYDTSNSNNIIGYYTIRAIGGQNVYDIDQVYFTNFNGVLNDAITIFVNNYEQTNDDSASLDLSYNYIKNNVSIESNSLNGSALDITIKSWLVGYVGSNFNVYSGYFSDLYNSAQAIQTAYENGTTDGITLGLAQANLTMRPTWYNQGYSEGLADGRQEMANQVNDDSYHLGYTDGVKQANGGPKFIYSLFSAPFVFMRSLFNFELFGINFYNIILTLLSMILVYVVLKFILSRVG